MFQKILIANRGEIACRVIATARRLGIVSVAIYSEADGRALHVALADEAWPVGPAPARESYLAIGKIIDVAGRAGAEAIHPGYGFLAENADFAEACAAAGIVFIGPPPAAIRAMGSKAAAKALMERSGVPLVSGYHGAAQDFSRFRAEAERIGYPVLVKASAGGGGKGMRVAAGPEELAAAIEGARSEARNAFGDDRLLIEKYMTAPRHIEIQVFADAYDHVVSLFERDCSIQRRHQKVIEEAPAPGMSEAQRQAMGEAACRAARAVGYVGAGTVEFIASGEKFHFMEMNTRLQVEHPVTEMITGEDLVEWQLRIAAGEALPLSQDRLRVRGHAIEARICAEDPAHDFRPSTGTLIHVREPPRASHLRIDSGVGAGDAITPYYDPMIAKLIVHGETRATAVRRLAAALAQYEIVGVETNLALLRAIAAHSDFARGALDTGFIAREAKTLLAAPAGETADPVLWAAAALAALADARRERAAEAAASADPFSPWNEAGAWRMNGDGYQDLVLTLGEETVRLRIHPEPGGACRLDLPPMPMVCPMGGSLRAEAAEDAEGGMALRLEGVLHHLRVVRRADMLVVVRGGCNHVFHVADPLAPPAGEEAGSERLVAPIPARIARVLVKAGERVRKGDPLIVLEAMKMEMTIVAPLDGVVENVLHGAEEMVEEGTELVTFAAPPRKSC